MFKIDESTIDAIANGYHIPPKPEALTELQELDRKGEHDVIKAAQVIEKDVELSGVVLKTINSPLFGLRRKVLDVKQAVNALGFYNTFGMVTACVLKQSFSGKAAISLDRFWDEAMEAAELCRRLSQNGPFKTDDSEAYIIGLFHDCGIAALAMRYEDYEDVLVESNNSIDFTQVEIERKYYEHDHAYIGMAISTSWSMPERINQIILHHHDRTFDSTDDSFIDLWCMLKVAMELTIRQRQGHHDVGWDEVYDFILQRYQISDDTFQELLNNVAI